MGETIILRTSDGFGTTAYLARPKGKPKGALVVVQEIFGVNHHMRCSTASARASSSAMPMPTSSAGSGSSWPRPRMRR